jgi:hypothetical protein
MNYIFERRVMKNLISLLMLIFIIATPVVYSEEKTVTTTTTTTHPDGTVTTTVEETTTPSEESETENISTPKLVGPTGVTGTIRRSDRRQDRRAR